MDTTNETIVDEFILQGFPGNSELHNSLFAGLFLAYFVTMVGNIFIILVICSDYRLHSPMYFFLVCLSFMDLLMVSFVIPKLLAILLNKKTISRMACITQSYLYYFVTTVDLLILTVMSIDRYVAICYPLRYSSIMQNNICFKLLFGCLITPFICLFYPTVVISNLPFCSQVVDHFFCETTAMLKLVCADVSLIKLNTIISSVLILIGCLCITAISYLFIVVTVIRMPSDTGRRKTFSTCLSHLTMLSLVFGSAIFILIRPPKDYSVETDKLVNLVSTVIAPLLNPFIYTLRNQTVKDSIRHAIKSTIFIHKEIRM